MSTTNPRYARKVVGAIVSKCFLQGHLLFVRKPLHKDSMNHPSLRFDIGLEGEDRSSLLTFHFLTARNQETGWQYRFNYRKMLWSMSTLQTCGNRASEVKCDITSIFPVNPIPRVRKRMSHFFNTSGPKLRVVPFLVGYPSFSLCMLIRI